MKYSENLIEDVIQGLDDNSFEIRYCLDK